jgi:hypothetical protein
MLEDKMIWEEGRGKNMKKKKNAGFIFPFLTKYLFLV